MADAFQAAYDPASRLSFGVAVTTSVCREAQRTHQLEATSAIALGRLLTATAIVANTHRRYDMASLQVVCWGRMGQIFADINHAGHLRGYVKNPFMALPILPSETAGGRRSIARGIGGGTLSVIRAESGQGFTQGTTELTNCEVDADVQTFLARSDQIPTTLICDVLVDDKGFVRLAAGIALQALPDADMQRYAEIAAHLGSGRFTASLASHGAQPETLLRALVDSAEPAGDKIPLAFKCRCSYERVVAALRMLGPQQLAEMVQTGEEPAAACEFCGTQYKVGKEDVERAFNDTIVARG